MAKKSVERILETIVPAFDSIADARETLAAEERDEPADLYPRDGTLALARLEAHVARLIGAGKREVISYNTGMTAVVDALEITGPTRGTVILYPGQSYRQTGRYAENVLRDQRGCRAVKVDTGSPRALSLAIDRTDPDILVFETVANGQGMPVLDTDELFAHVARLEKKPLVILDNTMATPTGLPLARLIKNLPFSVIVVESGTKFYALNQETFGVSITNDHNLLMKLREKRQMIGSLPSASSVRTIEQIILPAKEEFDRRNKTIFGNTHALAKASAKAEGGRERFAVVYPNLPTHPNFELAARLFPDGAAPVFFIQSAAFNDQGDAIARALWENPVIRGSCELGQSFGFAKTRIWLAPNDSGVRVSGGLETKDQLEILQEAFKESLSNMH